MRRNNISSVAGASAGRDALTKELAFVKRFVPHILVQRFNDNPHALREPESAVFPAAVGFFDISGFSALAHKLEQAERRGSDIFEQTLLDNRDDASSTKRRRSFDGHSGPLAPHAAGMGGQSLKRKKSIGRGIEKVLRTVHEGARNIHKGRAAEGLTSLLNSTLREITGLLLL